MMEMERPILGKTGLEVGILGLGGANHVKAGQEELNSIIDRAEQVGANCLNLYWNCEELRVQATCTATGQAAGAMVALSAATGVDPEELQLPDESIHAERPASQESGGC